MPNLHTLAILFDAGYPALEAAIVRRIFEEFAKGRSPRAIGGALNKEAISGPRNAWGPSTIYGNWRRGTGILNNELYIGRLVWNRQQFIKDPHTGRRQARLNPETKWIVESVPHLRIVDDQLWNLVKERQRASRTGVMTEYKGVRSMAHAGPATFCPVCSDAEPAVAERIFILPFQRSAAFPHSQDPKQTSAVLPRANVVSRAGPTREDKNSGARPGFWKGILACFVVFSGSVEKRAELVGKSTRTTSVVFSHRHGRARKERIEGAARCQLIRVPVFDATGRVGGKRVLPTCANRPTAVGSIDADRCIL
jgi:Recombinase